MEYADKFRNLAGKSPEEVLREAQARGRVSTTTVTPKKGSTYRGLAEHLIDKDQREAAQAAMTLVIRDLELTPREPELRFFSGLPPKGTDTSVNPIGVYEWDTELCRGIVWLKVDQSPADSIHTVVHEARHGWQSRWGWGRVSTEKREQDAESYAHRWLKAYGLRADYCSARLCRFCSSWGYKLPPMRSSDVARFVRKVLHGYSLIQPGEDWGKESAI